MKNLFVPPLGTELTLAADWTFALYDEHRNDGLYKGLKIPFPLDGRSYGRDMLSKEVTLPAGTVLTVRRYYIRLGQNAFDSVTFSAKIGKKSHRFWVKLADANRIQLADE